MPVLYKLKIPIIRDVSQRRLLEAEGTGSTFHPKCLYFLATKACHPARYQSSSALLSEAENSYFP
jgi:hypothetical protein